MPFNCFLRTFGLSDNCDTPFFTLKDSNRPHLPLPLPNHRSLRDIDFNFCYIKFSSFSNGFHPTMILFLLSRIIYPRLNGKLLYWRDIFMKFGMYYYSTVYIFDEVCSRNLPWIVVGYNFRINCLGGTISYTS